MFAWRAGAAIGIVAAAVALGGCSAAGGESADISIVASTSAWGAVAQELIKGLPPGQVAVTSILSDPNIDPHSYEASARDELALSRADLVIENGGGYDDFVDSLLGAADYHPPIINAVQLSGNGDANEHVWYDLQTVEKVAHRIVRFVVARQPNDAGVVRQNARAFSASLHRLEATEAAIKAEHDGAGVAITEPVPLYLLQACGLVNRTPSEFSNAIEQGTDASPRVLQTMFNLFRAHQVRLLVYNEQTAGPQTDQVVSAARQNAVPVVGVTETLPASLTYPQWIGGVLRDIAGALS
jgi:zinc/manganese transport system substrate-binding protein